MKTFFTALTVSLIAIRAAVAGTIPSDSLIIASVVSPTQCMATGATGSKGTDNNGHQPSGITGFLLKAYHTWISSQDGETCTFSQSCSSFGAWAVREKGLLVGLVVTADRLTRCNGVKPERYPVDQATKKNSDDYPDLLQ